MTGCSATQAWEAGGGWWRDAGEGGAGGGGGGEVDRVRGLWVCFSTGHFLVDVASHASSVYTFRPEEDGIAWPVAVRLPIMLRMASWC